MAVRTASKLEPALGRRPMPTNVIPLAGFPSPPTIHRHLAPLPQCRHGTMEDSCQPFVVVLNSLFPVAIVIDPSAGGGVGNALVPTTGRSPSGRISDSPQLRERQCRALVGRLIEALHGDANGVSALQHSARSAIPLALLIRPNYRNKR